MLQYVQNLELDVGLATTTATPLPQFLRQVPVLVDTVGSFETSGLAASRLCVTVETMVPKVDVEAVLR